MAQRDVNSDGWDVRAVFSTNSRFPSSPIRAPHDATSTSPEDERIASMMRALSRSVCSRPIIHVPALDMSL